MPLFLAPYFVTLILGHYPKHYAIYQPFEITKSKLLKSDFLLPLPNNTYEIYKSEYLILLRLYGLPLSEIIRLKNITHSRKLIGDYRS